VSPFYIYTKVAKNAKAENLPRIARMYADNDSSIVADCALFHALQVSLKLGVSQQFQRFAPSQIAASTQESGFSHVLNLVPFASGSSAGSIE
jgi:hypothetical protein